MLGSQIAALPDHYEPVSFHVLAWPSYRRPFIHFTPSPAFIHPVLIWTGNSEQRSPIRMVEALMHPDDHALLMMIVAAQPDASMSAPGWPVVMTYDLWCTVMQGGGT